MRHSLNTRTPCATLVKISICAHKKTRGQGSGSPCSEPPIIKRYVLFSTATSKIFPSCLPAVHTNHTYSLNLSLYSSSLYELNRFPFDYRDNNQEYDNNDQCNDTVQKQTGIPWCGIQRIDIRVLFIIPVLPYTASD